MAIKKRHTCPECGQFVPRMCVITEQGPMHASCVLTVFIRQWNANLERRQRQAKPRH